VFIAISMQNSVRSKDAHSDESQLPLGGFLVGSQESTHERFLQIGHTSIGGSNAMNMGNILRASAERSTTSLAQWFLRHGCKPGDRIAFYWPNSIETVELFFACFKAGMRSAERHHRQVAASGTEANALRGGLDHDFGFVLRLDSIWDLDATKRRERVQ
jgi:AMP-binding enzyme